MSLLRRLVSSLCNDYAVAVIHDNFPVLPVARIGGGGEGVEGGKKEKRKRNLMLGPSSSTLDFTTSSSICFAGILSRYYSAGFGKVLLKNKTSKAQLIPYHIKG